MKRILALTSREEQISYSLVWCMHYTTLVTAKEEVLSYIYPVKYFVVEKGLF